MTEYLIEDTALIAMADGIRAKTGKTNALSLDDIIAGIDEVYEKGYTNGSASLDAFIGDTLTGLIISSTKIAAYSCYGRTQLRSVYLPNATQLLASVFANCTNLINVRIPNLQTLATYCFQGCSSLPTVTFTNYSVVIPQSCFVNCKALIKADLRASSIGAYAFQNCSSLDTLILRAGSRCTLSGVTAFSGTLIASGTGYIYVLKALLDSYKGATNWSTYANQFRAIEDYPEITGG